jgi:hypothetical protein
MSFLSRLKFEFTINTLFIGILLLIIGSGVASYMLTSSDPYEVPIGSLPVPIQVGKNKVFVSKTGDASMATEYRRRRAVIGSNSCGYYTKFSHSGSTNGSLETYFLSGMCPTFNKPRRSERIYDGGDATTESNTIFDAGTAETNIYDLEIDLGDALTSTVYFI